VTRRKTDQMCWRHNHILCTSIHFSTVQQRYLQMKKRIKCNMDHAKTFGDQYSTPRPQQLAIWTTMVWKHPSIFEYCKKTQANCLQQYSPTISLLSHSMYLSHDICAFSAALQIKPNQTLCYIINMRGSAEQTTIAFNFQLCWKSGQHFIST
jgi:hypothetical protein